MAGWGGFGESGGVMNSVDESLVSSVNEGVLDLGVLAGESSGGVGEGEGEAVESEGVGTSSTSSEAGRGPRRPSAAFVSLSSRGNDARHGCAVGWA